MKKIAVIVISILVSMVSVQLFGIDKAFARCVSKASSNCPDNTYSCWVSLDSTTGISLDQCLATADSYNPPACYEYYEVTLNMALLGHCDLYSKNGSPPPVTAAPGTLNGDCRTSGSKCDSGLAPVTGAAGDCKCRVAAAAGMVKPFDPRCDGNGDGVITDLDDGFIDTALGCLPTDPNEFVKLVIPWATGIGGGVAFLLMLYGTFMVIVSAGVPEKMQAGKELIGSAVTGLLIIIFAVFILRFIGVDILGLFS